MKGWATSETFAPERERGYGRGSRDASRAEPALDPVLGTSLVLSQFRQFCERLIEGRDRLERASTQGSAPVVAPEPAAPLSATAAAIAAADAAIATAQAEAAAAIAAATGRPLAAATPAADTPAWASADPVVTIREELRTQLLSSFEQQTYQAMQFGGAFAIGTLREAQYVMAALADEVLLNANWAGKRGWRLLEEELFRSHASGELFFTRLDALLKLGEAGSVELAMVFYQALALDFRGKYRNNDPTRQLSRYRRQLFNSIFRETPEAAAQNALAEQAYAPTVIAGEFKNLPTPFRWSFAVAGVVLLWLLISSIVWAGMSSGLSHQLDRIHTYAPNTPVQAVR